MSLNAPVPASFPRRSDDCGKSWSMDGLIVDLPTALASARAIYGTQFRPEITLKALSYFEDGDVPTLPERVKDRLARAARAVDLDRLPVLAPYAGGERGPAP